MSINLKIGDSVTDKTAAKTVAEVGRYNEVLDLLPVKFSDDTYGVCYGSLWAFPGTLLHSDDAECERLLSQATGMPSVEKSAHHILIRFRRKAGFLRRDRRVVLAISYDGGNGREDQVDRVIAS